MKLQSNYEITSIGVSQLGKITHLEINGETVELANKPSDLYPYPLKNKEDDTEKINTLANSNSYESITQMWIETEGHTYTETDFTLGGNLEFIINDKTWVLDV